MKEAGKASSLTSFRELNPRSVSGILQLGGTILYTSRCLEFEREEGIRKAAVNLGLNDIDGLVVIGGNGSFNGALALSKETDTRIVGIPTTIDNDVSGTDETVGFDTAVNTAVKEIDKIRDTAVSHDRIFIVEVMGRNRGFLAAMVGFTVGAEIILVPEVPFESRGYLQSHNRERIEGKALRHHRRCRGDRRYPRARKAHRKAYRDRGQAQHPWLCPERRQPDGQKPIFSQSIRHRSYPYII